MQSKSPIVPGKAPPKATHPQPVTEVPKVTIVTSTRKRARPNTREPKSTTATKPATGKTKKKAAASVKTAIAKPTTPDLVVPTLSSTNPLEEISDLDSLPHQAYGELTLYIHLIPAHKGSRSRSALKTVILFVAEYEHAIGEQRGVKPCASPAGMQISARQEA
jgi:hypothetical protein